MAKQIKINDLDFDGIKQNLKDFLRSQSKFQDYDFEGSNLSIILDLLAYVTHYTGYYTHMLNSESRVDSAKTRSSLVSMGKLVGYTPRSKRASRAKIQLSVGVTPESIPSTKFVVIPRGTAVKSINNSTDTRTFWISDDLYVHNISGDASAPRYVSKPVEVFEGEYNTHRFVVDNTLTNQKFKIPFTGVDTTTLKITVRDSELSTKSKVFKPVTDFIDVNGQSNVYFLSATHDGYYEISFGNGVYGSALQHGQIIDCGFIVTNGESGNNARQFQYSGDFEYMGEFYPISIDTIEISSGGSDIESLDEMRFNIPNHFRAQNRSVMVDDCKNILLREFQNIDSINVWGGEDNIPKQYGHVFVCIKPSFGHILSQASKDTVVDIIRRKSPPGIRPVVVDADYLFITLQFNVLYNPNLTTLSPGELESRVKKVISDYNDGVLNKFESFYSDLELNTLIKNSDDSVLSSYSKIGVSKDVVVANDITRVDFGVGVTGHSLYSSEFDYRMRKCVLRDNGTGSLLMYGMNDDTGDFELFPNETYGEVDYESGVVTISGVRGTHRVRFSAKPARSDIHMKRNSVILIDNAEVTLEPNRGNESER